MSLSEIEKLALLPDAQIEKILEDLGEEGQYQLLYDWGWNARPEQLAPIMTMGKNWRIWLIMAGRGFGKTRAGAEWVRSIAHHNPDARIALIGANHHEARSIMVTGESGLLSIGPQDSRPIYESSLRRVTYPNGAQAYCYSAGEAEALRGPQHSHAWCDELAKWNRGDGQDSTDIWANLWMGMRLGENPQCVVTTTPRSVPLLKQIIAEHDVIITKGSTHENRANLPSQFIASVSAQYGGTALGRQELNGELIEDVEGALWSRTMIESIRVSPKSADEMQRIIVAVDPPISAHGDACGIIVAGVNDEGLAFVLADHSIEKASPETWARKVAETAALWSADRIIAEANQGGAMVKSVLSAAGLAAPVTLVHASRGKVARAEPVAALYEARRVFHAGIFAHLEDQCCGLMMGGDYIGPGRSPDRADALVWAMTELLLGKKNSPKIRY